MKNAFISMLKGLWVGGTLTVPGVSGGSMAMILGIYDKLVFSVNALIKKGGEKKKALLFLLWTALGGMVGFIIFSRLVGFLLNSFPIYVCCFFVGAVAGSIPFVLKMAKIKKVNILDFVMVAFGVLIVMLISIIPSGLFSINGIAGFGGIALRILCGIILAFGLVLPGISFSQMLYVFGIYTEVMGKISSFDILPLIPFGIGGIFGIFACSLLVEFLMKKFTRQVYMVIFGFILGSLPTMFKGQSILGIRWWSIPILILLVCVGFFLVYAISKTEEKR